MLWDGTLTVAEIGSRRYSAEFAGLAACKTATGGVHAPDEVVTLASALFYRGYRHVVGTLWSIGDTAIVSAMFKDLYEQIVTDGCLRADHAARALHRAVRRLRDDHRGEPEGMEFIHPYRVVTATATLQEL